MNILLTAAWAAVSVGYGASPQPSWQVRSSRARVLADGSAAGVDALRGLDPEQIRMMDERVAVVDRYDRVLGAESKVNAHLNARGPMLHRAFSVFLFDDQGRLLLQQRAPEKVTFPSCWTNTCCSHPLHSADELGAGAGGLLDGAVVGCARAAIRKLEQELGVPRATFTPEAFVFLNRIHYLSRARADAPAVERAEFGEHEIDYLYVLRAPAAGLPLAPNPNEVCATRYVDRAEMQAMLAAARRGELRLTPWFEMIAEQFLFKWWAQLDDERALLAMRDSVGIFRFGECADDV